MRDRKFFAIGILVALIVAGGLSLGASQSPDGLQKVAQDLGFSDTAKDSATAASPLAGYQTSFLHDGLGRSLAGIIGVLVTLALFTLLTKALSRRSPGAATPSVAPLDED